MYLRLSTQPLEAACRVTYDAAQPTTSVGSGWGRFLCGRPHRVGDVLISGKSAGERPAASPGAGPAAATPPTPTPRPLSLRHRRLVFKRNYNRKKKTRPDCPVRLPPRPRAGVPAIRSPRPPATGTAVCAADPPRPPALARKRSGRGREARLCTGTLFPLHGCFTREPGRPRGAAHINYDVRDSRPPSTTRTVTP